MNNLVKIVLNVIPRNLLTRLSFLLKPLIKTFGCLQLHFILCLIRNFAVRAESATRCNCQGNEIDDPDCESLMTWRGAVPLTG